MSIYNPHLKLPNDTSLPFFAYGIFKPNQLAYSRISEYVRNAIPEEINYRMLMRDGVPLIVPPITNKVQHHCQGYLIYFKEDCSNKAYETISNNEPEKLYKWEVIRVGENKANVLMGVNPELGSSPMYENEGCYDGKNDPLFNEALRVIEQELNDKNKHWSSVDDFFKLQMAYMLLWSSIDRYLTLKYPGHSFGDYHKQFAKEKAFKDSLKRHVTENRKVYSAQDLREYTLDSKKSFYSLKYYYTIRCNVVHRGKAIHGDEYMLRASLTELLNIFKDVLGDTFNCGD